MKSPILIISERDIVDKRIEFTYDEIYYNFSTSVEKDVRFIFMIFKLVRSGRKGDY